MDELKKKANVEDREVLELMKLQNIKLDAKAIGNAIYLGLEDSVPRQVNGQAGTYQRHLLMNKEHGLFFVLTKALDNVIEENSTVSLEGTDPVFFEDYYQGRNMAPCVSVFAKTIKVVK